MSGQRDEEEEEFEYEEEEEEWETMPEDEAEAGEDNAPSAPVDIISHNDDDDTISEVRLFLAHYHLTYVYTDSIQSIQTRGLVCTPMPQL